MNLLALNEAYRYVAVALMLAQVNFFCNKLELPLEHSVTKSDLRPGGHVAPPGVGSFGGSVVTDRYFFGFGRGHLANFTKLGYTSTTDADVQHRNIELSKLKSIIDTNGAYQLTTNWLAKLGVDIPSLEKKYRLNITQWRYYPTGQPSGGLTASNGNVVMLPVYEVQWRGSLIRANRKRPEEVLVSMTILGATKELLAYHLLDDALILSPAIHIKDPEKLLVIQDEDFQKYSELQRNNLVTQFIQGTSGGTPEKIEK